jgi:hypothetical protein
MAHITDIFKFVIGEEPVFLNPFNLINLDFHTPPNYHDMEIMEKTDYTQRKK